MNKYRKLMMLVLRNCHLLGISGIPFQIESGLNLKDIIIEVTPRMCIRVQILLSNGTPLTNVQGKLNLQYQTLDGMNSDDLSFYPTYTDSDGYF